MNFNELLTLIEKIDHTSVAYVDYSHAGDHVVLAKEVPFGTSAVDHSASTKKVNSYTDGSETNQSVSEQSPASFDQPAPTEEVEAVLEAEAPEGEAILSPMVGVAYLQAGPDSEPYVQVGDTVKQGDVVVLIEAMKLMNEIQAPKSGVVTEILVDNDSVVEYNQPLIRIK